MCCPLIVYVMLGVSTKAYSDPCDCWVNWFLPTRLPQQLQEHSINWENTEAALSLMLLQQQQPPLTNVCHLSAFPGCYKITTVFSHAQTVVLCVGCSTVLCQPTGGKARLTEGTMLVQNRMTTHMYMYSHVHSWRVELQRAVFRMGLFRKCRL